MVFSVRKKLRKFEVAQMKKATVFFAKNLRWFTLAFFVILAVLPLLLTSNYSMRMITICMLYVMMALSLNLLTGYLGIMTIGHIAFMGIGAYTAAILIKNHGWTTIPAYFAAVLLTGIFGLLLALAALKLQGYYMTILTLGFCEIIRLIEINWVDLTRGALGIAGISSPVIFGIRLSSRRAIYYCMLVLLILTLFIIYSLINSKAGNAIIAIREDELAARSMGINVFYYKVVVFVLSAMIMGLAGAFYAQYMTYIDPAVFTVSASLNILIMAIFGGLGNILGTVIGASVLTILPETIRFLSEYRNLVYGVLIIVLMLVKPDGLLGKVNFKYIRQQAEAHKESEVQG